MTIQKVIVAPLLSVDTNGSNMFITGDWTPKPSEGPFVSSE